MREQLLTDRQTNKQTNKQTDRQTHRTTTVTLAAHARRGLIMHIRLLTIYIIVLAGASPPSRTASIIFLFIYLYPCRTSCSKSSTCFLFSEMLHPLLFPPDISIFRLPCAMEFYSSPLDSLGLNLSSMDSCAMDPSAIFYTTSQVLIVYCYDSYKQNPNKCIVHVLCRCCCTCR